MELHSYLSAEFLPGSGLTPGFVFGQVLTMLRDARLGAFAVAFPHCEEGGAAEMAARRRPSLGKKLQIFGPPEVVGAAAKQLARFQDYLAVEAPRPVRPARLYASFQRVHDGDRSAATVEREIRRALRRVEAGKRPPLDQDELRQRGQSVRASDTPYIAVRSHTTGQTFNVGFRKVLCEAPVAGGFDQFGFGKAGATVPHLP